MGCVYPVRIKNNNYTTGGVKIWQRHQYYYVPCGKCLGCMIAKQTFLADLCNWEYNHYGVGAFVTLTYDNDALMELEWNENGEPLLNYEDFKLFNKRLRKRLADKYGTSLEFKFVAVGEYGTEGERPHFHALYFGLDWQHCDQDIYDAWGKGITDSKPIKEGAINYVLKYMQKDIMRNKKAYGLKKNNEPFLKHSINLGKGFIEEHMEEIIKNNGMYDNGSGKLRPISSYWCNKLGITPVIDYTDAKKEIGAINKVDWETVSKKQAMEYLKNKAQIKEEQYIRTCRRQGQAQKDFNKDWSESLWREKID